MISPFYIPSPDQTDIEAQTRAQVLGVGIAPRAIPPAYAPHIGILPGVAAEYGQANVVFAHDDGTLTTAQVSALVAPLISQQTAAATVAENKQMISDRAVAALASNAAYLAIATPSNVQIAAQVNRVTRECSALIRLLLGQFDSTADS